jgi:plasmid stabilization system protein ParE
MKPIYSRQAIADLDKISAYYASAASPTVARAVRQRLIDVVDRIGQAPNAGQLTSQRSGVRVVPVITFPYWVFYRIRNGRLEIVRIRHTSRRPLRTF